MNVKELTPIDYDICDTQARIYLWAAKNNYDLKIFSDKYMQSDFTRRAMDTIYSRFQINDELECLDFILPEIGHSLIKTNKYINTDFAYWLGFTYRQMYIETKIKSSQLVILLPYDSLLLQYPGLHTIDEESASDILCEKYGLKKIEQ